jgi:hypothetical protein
MASHLSVSTRRLPTCSGDFTSPCPKLGVVALGIALTPALGTFRTNAPVHILAAHLARLIIIPRRATAPRRVTPSEDSAHGQFRLRLSFESSRPEWTRLVDCTLRTWAMSIYLVTRQFCRSGSMDAASIALRHTLSRSPPAMKFSRAARSWRRPGSRRPSGHRCRR